MTHRAKPWPVDGKVAPFYDHAGITIYRGDCREILPHLDFDVCVSDPPYGIGYVPNHSGGTDCEWFDEKIAGDESTAVRDAILETLPKSMPTIVFGTWKAPRPRGVRAVLIWDKGPAGGAGDLSFPWKLTHEEIYIIGDGFAGHRGESVLRHTMVTWATIGREPRQHPTQKPKNLGRQAIGIELDERYCEVAVERLAQEVLFR